MESITNQRTSSSYAIPKAGMHRARSKSELTISTLDKKTSRAKRFFERVQDMDHDLAEIRSRTLIYMTPRKTNESPPVSIAFLQSKLEKIRDRNYFASADLIENLERIKKLSESYYSDEEYKSVLRAQIDYVSESLGKGILYYEDFSGQRCDLLDYINLLAYLEKGKELLREDKKLFFQFSNAQIISLSKKLSLAYPRIEEYENHFTQLIETISSFHGREESVPYDEMESLIKSLIDLNERVQRCFDETLNVIQTELSLLLKPDPNQDFSIPNVNQNSLFIDTSLIDDPAKEDRRKALDNVLTEILKSEETFGKKVAAIADSHLFPALFKEKLISIVELDCLQKGWSELKISSLQLQSILAITKEAKPSVLQKFECFLAAFVPQYIDSHMENCKTIMCNFMNSNSIIKNIQLNPKGQQMLLSFSAMNRLDIIDIFIMPVQRPPRYILLLKEVCKIMEPENIAVKTRIAYLEQWVKAINFYAPPFSK